MLFNSFQFLFFMILVFIIYWSCPHRLRWFFLLGFSYYFYMCWEPKYILLILGVSLVSYFGAMVLRKSGSLKKPVFAISLTLILSVLFFFKYFNFFTENLTRLLRKFALPVHPFTLKVILPMGISFYTFQCLSYLIDVYKGKIEPERHFGFFALYVAFFPQLVAGPIERPQDLIPQLKSEKRFNYQQAMDGIQFILIGLFKKVVISNTVAKGVDLIYGNLGSYTGGILIVATTLFAIQIYCDFSGYSDIAMGSAKLLGIELIRNFDCPYLADSVSDFWRRWHISLTRWLRDYIYIPLGGNRVSKVRQIGNRMITFLASGLWHGASWTYVIWGGLNGVYLVVENLIRDLFGSKKKIGKIKVLHIIITFMLIDFTWIFFRAETISDAVYIITHMFSGIASPFTYVLQTLRTPHVLSKVGAVILAVEFAILGYIEYICYRYHGYEEYMRNKGKAFNYIFKAVLLASVIILCTKNGNGEFIYFQF